MKLNELDAEIVPSSGEIRGINTCSHLLVVMCDHQVLLSFGFYSTFFNKICAKYVTWHENIQNHGHQKPEIALLVAASTENNLYMLCFN